MNKTVKIKVTRSEIEEASKVCEILHRVKENFCAKCIIAHLLNEKLENSKIIEAGYTEFTDRKINFNISPNQFSLCAQITHNFDSCVLSPDKYPIEEFIQKYENTELEFIQTDRAN